MASMWLGPFELIKPVARGGTGEVWRAIHRDGVGVAVKLLPCDRFTEETRGAFHKEVRAVASLQHPNIVWIYDSGEVSRDAARRSAGQLTAGSPYLAMELGTGKTLADVEVESYQHLRRILLDLLDALAHAHARGVIHRDIKPRNVLVAPPRPGEGPGGLLLADFGMVYALGEPNAEPPQHGGTLAFMAPEQCANRWSDQGPWTDLYGLGCVAYALTSGKPPFRGSGSQVLSAHLHQEPPALRPRFPVPAGFRAWVYRMLCKDPAQRYSWAADAARELPGAPDPPPPLTRWPRPPRPPPMQLHGVGLRLFGRRPLPVVGRQRLQHQLWSALQEVCERRRPVLVVLAGPTGCGKSKLAAWIARCAHEVGAAVALRAHHLETSDGRDGLPGMLLQHLRCEATPSAVTPRVREVLIAQGVDDEHEWRALAELLGPSEPERLDSVSFSAPAERHALVWRMLQRLAGARAVVTHLDDVHFGADTLSFCRYALAQDEPLPALLVGTATDEVLARRSVEAALLEGLPAQVLRVESLEREPFRDLVRDMLHLTPEVAVRLEDRADGNPLFAVQMVNEWVRHGLLEPSEAGFSLRPGAALTLPDDLAALWVPRLEALLAGRPRTDGLALEVAAALGRVVQDREWQAACAVVGIPAPRSLVRAMVDSCLAVENTDGTWAFVHTMVREAVEARAGGRWAGHHRACAEALGSADAARLGRHLAAACQFEQALDPLLQGARQARERADLRSATALIEDHQAAFRASGLPTSDRRYAEGCYERAGLMMRQARFHEVSQWATRAMELAREGGQLGLESASNRLLSAAAMAFGDATRCYELGLRAHQLAVEADDAQLAGLASVSIGKALLHHGVDDRVDPWFCRAIEELTDPRGLVDAWLGRVFLAIQLHHPEQAADHLVEARRHAEAAGALHSVAHCEIAQGEILRHQGRYEDALGCFRDAQRRLERLGSSGNLWAMNNLGWTLAELGRIGEARDVLERGLAIAAPSKRAGVLVGLRVGLLVCEADSDRWQEHFSEASRLLEETGRADADMAHMLVQAADRAEAAGHTDRALVARELAVAQLEALDRSDEAQALARTTRQPEP